MLITDEICYIELHKTGCTHTLNILSELFEDNFRIVSKHNTYDTLPSDVLEGFEGKLKVGNIRNPWDWYVSLWTYGCQKMGWLYSELTKEYTFSGEHSYFGEEGIKFFIKKTLGMEYARLDPEIWKKIYSDPFNFENFNSWLELVLSPDKFYIPGGYKKNKMSDFAGFFTWRYLRLYTYRRKFLSIHSKEELLDYDRNENFMGLIIRNEALDDGIIELAKKIDFDLDKLNKILSKYQERTNKSERIRDYRKYYNDKSISLVSQYDSLIIEKYNYKFE